MNYQQEFYNLKKRLEAEGFVVGFVPYDTFLDFAAMNRATAKKFGLKMPNGLDIAIEVGHPWRKQYKNLVHEAQELYDEEKKHMCYWLSHIDATRKEECIK
jgi:hypothetical protein